MKYLLNVALALLALTFSASVANAGDKPIPKRDLPVKASEPSKITQPSTANEVTAPIELIKPETAIDNAINAPSKHSVEPNAEVSTVEPSVADPKAEDAKNITKPKKHIKTAKKHGHKKKHAHSYKKQPADTNSSQ